MHRKGIVFIFIYKLNNFEYSVNLTMPSPNLGNIHKPLRLSNHYFITYKKTIQLDCPL